MYKKQPGNPKISELSKSYRERSFNLTNLAPIKVGELGQKMTRFCAWCAEGKLTHGNQKYCSNDCSQSAMAWAYPQKEDALGMLLKAQDFKCNLCQFDYAPLLTAIHNELQSKYRYYRLDERDGLKGDFREAVNWVLIKRLKARASKDQRPEVDHIIPIYKGGQSLGLENHQAICGHCHRKKTSVDLSGKRKKLNDKKDENLP